MKEDSGRILEALDHLDPALLEDMDGQTTVKRRSVPMRILLAAACVAGLLMIGAVAVEVITGIQVGDLSLAGKFVGINEDTGEYEELYEDREGITVIAPDGFSWSRASKELWDMVAQAPEDRYYAYFDSQDELEKFLGFSLPKNSVLDEAEEGSTNHCVKEDDFERFDHPFALLDIWKWEDGSPDSLSINAGYYIQNPAHEPHDQRREHEDSGYAEYSCGGARLFLDLSVAAREQGRTFFQSYVFGNKEDTKLVREDYVTPNGLPVVIIREEDNASDYQHYHVHFALDGMGFSFWVSWPPCVDAEAILKSILDAYEVS